MKATTVNSLSAIRGALEGAGVEFVIEDGEVVGVLSRELHARAYIPGDGILVEASYDLLMDDEEVGEADSDTLLAFKLTEEALELLVARPILSEADAKAIVRKFDVRLSKVFKRWVEVHGLSSFGPRPCRVSARELNRLLR
jgi:hypothetical protein